LYNENGGVDGIGLHQLSSMLGIRLVTLYRDDDISQKSNHGKTKYLVLQYYFDPW
jgi:hypothetical protein